MRAHAALGLLAYRELSTFERLAADARRAPAIADRIALGGLAADARMRFEEIAEAITGSGADVAALVERFAQAFDAFGAASRPGDWSESLMSSYVYDGIMKDFSRAALAELAGPEFSAVADSLDDTRASSALAEMIGGLLARSPELAPRTALWGRRLVAEAVARGRAILAEHGVAEDRIAEVVASATTAHSARMEALGLVA